MFTVGTQGLEPGLVARRARGWPPPGFLLLLLKIRPVRKGLILILLSTELWLEQKLLAGYPFQLWKEFCEYVDVWIFLRIRSF